MRLHPLNPHPPFSSTFSSLSVLVVSPPCPYRRRYRLSHPTKGKGIKRKRKRTEVEKGKRTRNENKTINSPDCFPSILALRVPQLLLLRGSVCKEVSMIVAKYQRQVMDDRGSSCRFTIFDRELLFMNFEMKNDQVYNF